MIARELNIPKNNSFFLFGPRQSGKSTLLKSQFPAETTYYYDLLKTEEYLRLSAHPTLLREEVQSRLKTLTHVVIDEIQRVPELLNEVHHVMESGNSPVFILTGSSARKLKRSKANLLAGRALTYHLYPLTATELGSQFQLRKALEMGTLPSVYLDDNIDIAQNRLRSYVETYLKEEIELEAQVRQIGLFVRFLTVAGSENGNVLNFSNIARDTGTSYQTVKSYFQILEDTLLGQFLLPFHKSLRKRSSHHPKFYFFDPGVVRALTKRLTVPLESATSDFGRAFEHWFILEVIRRSDYLRLDYQFSFYRTESGAEVDLIVETPRGNVCAIEIKASDPMDNTHLRGLKSFAAAHPKAKLACACLAPRLRQSAEITILPYQDVIAWLQSF